MDFRGYIFVAILELLKKDHVVEDATKKFFEEFWLYEWLEVMWNDENRTGFLLLNHTLVNVILLSFTYQYIRRIS